MLLIDNFRCAGERKANRLEKKGVWKYIQNRESIRFIDWIYCNDSAIEIVFIFFQFLNNLVDLYWLYMEKRHKTYVFQ